MENFYTNCVCFRNKVYYRGIKNGKRISKIVNYKPSLFVPTNKETSYQSSDGKNLEKITFESIAAAKEFKEQYKDVQGFQIYGNDQFNYCFLADLFPNTVEYDESKVRIANIDIEVVSKDIFPDPAIAAEEIIAITIKFSDTNQIFVFGCGDWENKENKENITYLKCSDETDLLEQFIDVWSEDYPDIVTGWNVNQFDIPYLINRLTKICGEKTAKKLSPWGIFSQRSAKIMGKDALFLELAGIATIDYLDIYKKYAPNPNQESYKLNYIAHVELNERKVSYEEYGTLLNLYENDFQKFIDYNIKDVELVDKLESKMKLISLVINIAYDGKVNYSDVFSQVRLWEIILFNFLKKKKMVVPPKIRGSKKEKYKGAFVKEPQSGMHDWVVSFDLASLYPHLIAQYNISPDTLIEDDWRVFDFENILHRKEDLSFLKKENKIIAANGRLYKRDKTGFLSEILMEMFKTRDHYRKLQVQSQNHLEQIEQEMIKRGLSI